LKVVFGFLEMSSTTDRMFAILIDNCTSCGSCCFYGSTENAGPEFDGHEIGGRTKYISFETRL